MTRAEMDRLTIEVRKSIEKALLAGEEIPFQQAISSGEQVAWIAAVNAALWERQNRLRELQHLGVLYAAGAVAFEILKLNDWRARFTGEEKL